MARSVVVAREVGVDELLRRYEAEEDPRVRRRILVVLRVREGASTTRVERELGVNHRLVSLWVQRFNEEGFEGLRDRPRSGRPPKMSDEDLRRVLEKKPADLGYPLEGWTVRVLHVHLADREGSWE